MSLKYILQREFKGYKKEKLEKILEQLEDIGIITEKDICYLKEDDLNRMDLKDVELRKLLALKAEYQNGLYMTIKEIFRGEPDEKIENYLKVLLDIGINQADHLPLGLELIDSHPEFQEIDKRKIKQYVARNFKEIYDEFCEDQKQKGEFKKLEKTMKHELLTKKLDICKSVIDSRCHERQQITDHNQGLLKAKEEIIKNEGFFSWFTNDENKKANLDRMREENERRKRIVDEKIDDALQRFAITSGNSED